MRTDFNDSRFPLVDYAELETGGVTYVCHQAALPHTERFVSWEEMGLPLDPFGKTSRPNATSYSTDGWEELAEKGLAIANERLAENLKHWTENPESQYFKGKISDKAQLYSDIKEALGNKWNSARLLFRTGLSTHCHPNRVHAAYRHQCSNYDMRLKQGADRETEQLSKALDVIEIFRTLERFRPQLEALVGKNLGNPLDDFPTSEYLAYPKRYASQLIQSR